MNITANRQENGVARGDSGTFTGDGTALVATLGYRPQTVTLLNRTDFARLDKIDGMPDASTRVQLAAGTATIEDAITITDQGFTVASGHNVATNEYAWFAA